MQFKAKILHWHNGRYGESTQDLITTFSKNKILHHIDKNTGLPYPNTETSILWESNCPYELIKELDDHNNYKWKIKIKGNESYLDINLWNRFKANWMHKKYKIQNEPIGMWGLVIALASLIWQIVSTWITGK